MRSLLLFFLLILFVSSCHNPTTSENMINLRKLDGNWLSYKGVKFNENWRCVNANLIEGEGFSLVGVDTSFLESLIIERVDDSIYYRVRLGEQSRSIDFLLIEAFESSWTFINPENDFPSIINYSIQEDGLLTVTISDIEGNKKQLFYLKK